MRIEVLKRLVRIQRTVVRFGLLEFLQETAVHRRVKWLNALSPWCWFVGRRSGKRGERLRAALEDLGPVFVKFGQAVSTRRDLLPPDIADELVKLQDQVPPFEGEVARAAIEAALEQPVASVFRRFETAPLAAASIAQVHAAELPDGREVIVKVLRPGMREIIQRDLNVMHTLAALVDRHSTEGARLRPREVVQEYEKTILDELDLMREAANAAQLRRNFTGDDRLHVPEVHWDLTRTNVMVMERVRGIPIGEIERLRGLGTDFQKLAENGVAIFFTQVFRHNFFHADMHPGNIFVLADDPTNPRYAAVDFGIIGSLDPKDQEYLAQNFLAVFDRDYRRVATLHVESGWVPHDIRVEEMESAVRTICEPIFNKPLKDISFAAVLLRLFEALRRFDARIQPQLILLQKTLFNVEGLGRQLYPDLDIWKTATPVLRDWMREKHHPMNVAQRLWKQMPELLASLEAAPTALHRELKARAAPQPNAQNRFAASSASHWAQTEASGGVAGPSSSGRDAIHSTAYSMARTGATRIAGAILILAGTLWLGQFNDPEWLGWVLGLVGVAMLLKRAR